MAETDQLGGVRVELESRIPETMFLSALTQPEPKHKSKNREAVSSS